MLLFRLLLFCLQWPLALAATGYDMCYGGQDAICDAYLNVTCGGFDVDDPRPYYECICGTELPLKQACNECAYEYGIDKTMADNWFYTSRCSSMSIPIGTIPPGILSRVSEHTATITLSKSRTFDSSSYISAQRAKATSTTTEAYGRLGYENYTTTYGPGGYITPIETAPPSVEDMGSDVEGNLASKTGFNVMLLTGVLFVFGAGLILV